MTIKEKQDQIIEEFAMFDEWMDKYENIIDYGKELEGLNDSDKTDENIVRGCQSNVWLTATEKDGKLIFNADSDAIITKGIIGLLLEIFSGHTPQEIATTELYAIDEIGLKEHLSPNRANGLTSMVNKIKMTALAYRAKQNG
ncbi:SufE family protein [bacterium SCSIO 12643]|nr:SufE family protein [bacterium SCSIO 12643]